MFTTNQEINAAVDLLMEFAAGLDRGDVFDYSDIENVSCFPRYSIQWQTAIVKFRKRMLAERKIALRAIKTVGYKLCTKDEQLKWCAKNRQTRAIRQVTRGVREVGALPREELTLHQQRVMTLTIQCMVSERKTLRSGVREQAAEIRKTETLPMRKPANC